MDKETLGLMGVGAFGSLAVKHLSRYFDLVLYDPHQDCTALAKEYSAKTGTIDEAARCDIVMLAVPVQAQESVIKKMAPFLQKNALVLDVASVKCGPIALMQKLLPSTVSIVGMHPLFGPQSGKNGIAGLNIVLCPVRGRSVNDVRLFCRKKLKLKVFVATADEHDRQMAQVQVLTHLIAKTVVSLKLPEARFTTKTYDLMQQMVGMVSGDSDALFKAILNDNPYAKETMSAFFAAVRQLESRWMTVAKDKD